jgi:hypothetical protein
MKSCSISLAFRKMQIKTIVRAGGMAQMVEQNSEPSTMQTKNEKTL